MVSSKLCLNLNWIPSAAMQSTHVRGIWQLSLWSHTTMALKLANGRAINKYSSKTDHYKSYSSTVKQANGLAIHKYGSQMAVGGAIYKYGSKTCQSP